MLDSRPQQAPLVPSGEIELFARDMTATVAADVPLVVLQTRLAEVNQWLPIDGDPARTVGELVERNSTGPLRLGYGGWRDLLLGVQFTNGREELITAGGRAVKNVAGYDLTKFMVGQGGVFGHIITITTRTYRRPQLAMLAQFPPETRMINRLLPTPQKPQWMMLTSDELLCGFVGDPRTIAFYAATLKNFGPLEVSDRSVEEDIGHRANLWSPGREGTARVSVPPSRVSELVASLATEWVADPVFGIVLTAPCDPLTFFEVQRAAEAMGGTAMHSVAEKPPSFGQDRQRLTVLERLWKGFA